MLNKSIIIGRLGQDPKHRSGDRSPCTLSVATSERYKDRQTGEKKEITEWHRVVIFNERLAEFAEKYLKKGMLVYITGKMKTRKWQKDGQDHYTTEVVLSGFDGELQSLESIGSGGPPAATEEDYGYGRGGSGSSLADEYGGPTEPPNRSI
jgi:single-strand DNA-binding protein